MLNVTAKGSYSQRKKLVAAKSGKRLSTGFTGVHQEGKDKEAAPF